MGDTLLRQLLAIVSFALLAAARKLIIILYAIPRDRAHGNKFST